MAQVHVKALPIPLLKVISGGKSDKDIIILKLRRDPTSRTSDLYEFKIYLFDNGKTEEFFLFILNFNITPVA